MNRRINIGASTVHSAFSPGGSPPVRKIKLCTVLARVSIYVCVSFRNDERETTITGVKTEEIRKGRILGGLRGVWKVFSEILPLQKSKEKRRKT